MLDIDSSNKKKLFGIFKNFFFFLSQTFERFNLHMFTPLNIKFCYFGQTYSHVPTTTVKI